MSCNPERGIAEGESALRRTYLLSIHQHWQIHLITTAESVLPVRWELLSLGTCLQSMNSHDISRGSQFGTKDERTPKIRTVSADFHHYDGPVLRSGWKRVNKIAPSLTEILFPDLGQVLLVRAAFTLEAKFDF